MMEQNPEPLSATCFFLIKPLCKLCLKNRFLNSPLSCNHFLRGETKWSRIRALPCYLWRLPHPLYSLVHFTAQISQGHFLSTSHFLLGLSCHQLVELMYSILLYSKASRSSMSIPTKARSLWTPVISPHMTSPASFTSTLSFTLPIPARQVPGHLLPQDSCLECSSIFPNAFFAFYPFNSLELI